MQIMLETWRTLHAGESYARKSSTRSFEIMCWVPGFGNISYFIAQEEQ